MVTLGAAFFGGAFVHKHRAAIRARFGEPIIQTNLYNLRVQKLAIPGEGRDGAVDALGDGVLLANRRGKTWFVTADRKLQPLSLEIPLNLTEFASDPYNANTTDQDRFSVKDLLVQPRPKGVRVLASYLYWHREKRCNALRVSALETTADSLLSGKTGAGSWRTVFESTPCRELIESGDGRTRHVTLGAGGRLVPISDSQVLLTVSEFSAEYVADTANHGTADSYGKTILLDLNTGAASEFTRGHRNAQGLAIAPDGSLWETEHGARGGDELNLLVKGKHYGAPYVTYGTQYEMMTWPLSKVQGKHEGYEKPAFAWVPSIATSQLIALRGSAFPSWAGDLMIGTLGAQSLYRVRVEGGRVIFVEPMAIGHRIRDLVETAAGSIVLKTDDDFLVFLDNAERATDVDPVTRGQIVAGQCRSCHSMEAGAPGRIGPNLWDVVGRRVATTSDYVYSDALKKVGGDWTPERLRQFISNPGAFAPGNKMQTTATYTEQQLDDLLAYLRTLR